MDSKLSEVAREALLDMYHSGLVLDIELCSLFGLTLRELEEILHAEKRKAQIS